MTKAKELLKFLDEQGHQILVDVLKEFMREQGFGDPAFEVETVLEYEAKKDMAALRAAFAAKWPMTTEVETVETPPPGRKRFSVSPSGNVFFGVRREIGADVVSIDLPIA